MEATGKDREFWKVFTDSYEDILGDCNKRQENQLEAYWCRPAGNNQDLFRDNPKQRIFARLIKSYQNTTWHQIQLSIPQESEKKNNGEKRRLLITDHWFENSEIIETALNEIEKNAFFRNLAEDNDFVRFCRMAAKIVEKLELREYNFNEEQEANFDSLKEVIAAFFEDKFTGKDLKVSAFEKIIYEQLWDPYRTIMKMQKLLPGLGVALTCDFLKEAHLCNIAKPDVHICHVFSLMDGIPYSMDLTLVKRVSEFADAVCEADSNNFCGSGAYNVDKIVWMNCSDYDTDGDHEKKMSKDKFLKKLAEVVKAQKTGPEALQKQDRPFA